MIRSAYSGYSDYGVTSLYRVPKRSPVRRAASQAAHTVVFLLHFCTVQAPACQHTIELLNRERENELGRKKERERKNGRERDREVASRRLPPCSSVLSPANPHKT
jgi:hypothetical protein